MSFILNRIALSQADVNPAVRKGRIGDDQRPWLRRSLDWFVGCRPTLPRYGVVASAVQPFGWVSCQ
jgi:hypothetical protein